MDLPALSRTGADRPARAIKPHTQAHSNHSVPTMPAYIHYAAFGWLAVSGVLHFVIDVLSQYLRGKRLPGAETTLYYGLNSAFALGQVVFGLLGLYVAWRVSYLLRETPVLALSLAASLGWLAITFLFMEYWEPKLNAGIFCLLILALIAIGKA